MDAPHRPVMLREAVAGLAPERGGYFVDGTFGRGGHTTALLARLGDQDRLLALDKDPDALASSEALALRADPRLELVHGSFAQLAAFIAERGRLGQVAGVLMDLGVSSPQLDEAGRGFSFMRDGPLDMRMDTGRGITAAEWLADVSENELIRVLRDYGEERYARRIAQAIVARRSNQPLSTTAELAGLIAAAAPTREKGKHPATRSFQAIRIHINHELEELEAGLRQALEILRPGGRMAVISFHSLEDRIVKRFMRDESRNGGSTPMPWPAPDERAPRLARIGKAILPSAEETAENPRARSAVLRIAERLSA
ncbi:16S rRNA (cytosine1402-N4)-methyltransferase [Methylomagnum ishizawai]|uniref:Ribosomal RNA small subunit methyltransferase H n=1 Tax=Methylomagnum ishizawai TaxID=1760988 RepID=A0A1Y6CZR9_9GAMM|nr:16S rRNA (cytosine(1402)-N(4))-methyltransferase RsmH [Methylomagnum ishizawai]SMF93802.1 16S rRNA (cytosine1402-N4)-methyltransferase [Methylomagnum ishizawai]